MSNVFTCAILLVGGYMKVSINKICKPLLNQICRHMASKGVDVATLKTLDRKIQTKHSEFSMTEMLVFQYIVVTGIEALTNNPRRQDLPILSELHYLNDRIGKKCGTGSKEISIAD